jgi:hypothetical protein
MSLTTDYFTSFSPISMSFSCLIALVRNSFTMMYMNGGNRHFCFVSDLKGKAWAGSIA